MGPNGTHDFTVAGSRFAAILRTTCNKVHSDNIVLLLIHFEMPRHHTRG